MKKCFASILFICMYQLQAMEQPFDSARANFDDPAVVDRLILQLNDHAERARSATPIIDDMTMFPDVRDEADRQFKKIFSTSLMRNFLKNLLDTSDKISHMRWEIKQAVKGEKMVSQVTLWYRQLSKSLEFAAQLMHRIDALARHPEGLGSDTISCVRPRSNSV